MKNKIENIRVFSLLTICYILITFVVKVCELIYTIAINADIDNFSGIVYGNLASAMFVSFCFFLIYLIIALCSKKIAVYISSTLFSLMIMTEIGLIIYYKSTGLLMGNELINRPLWEIIHTIEGVTNIWILLLSLLLLTALISLFIYISRKKISLFVSRTIICLMIIAVPLMFLLKPNHDKNIVNKNWYCLYSCLTDNLHDNEKDRYGLSTITFDEQIIDEYKKTYPQRKIADVRYPLERRDNIDNVLGPYFKKVDTKPNIVFVIIESLGSDFFGQNKYSYTATPFLDSLSKHSLLWTNCLSTTARSAGVIPAVTASVPHGPKGFQFGDIPDCNSLFPILKHNGYNNNVFYAGSFKFDRVSDYLTSQEVDFMSPFHQECVKNKENNNYDYTSWGYHDGKMFERSIEIINDRDDDVPNLDMLITISQHDNKLVLNSNKDLENYYYEKAEFLLQSLPDDESKKIRRRKGFIAAFLYSDDALRNFFYSYTRKYENTIFVITGDHSLNSFSSNPLSAYHVPLIIWSPFIESPKHFHSVVSHNDIAPSLNALLRDNFKLDTPKYVHWISDGLDTSETFRSKAKTYFITQTNISTKLVFDDLYYTEDINGEKLFRIKDSIEVESVEDPELIKLMRKRINIVQYIDRYTYTNNRLTKNPIIHHKEYKLLNSVSIDSAYCASKNEKPSIAGIEKTMIHSESILPSVSQTIKVILTADMKYTADIHHHDFINLTIRCNNADWSSEVISKNIMEKNYRPNEWLKIEVTKTLNIIDIDKNTQIDIYISSPRYDIRWNPEHSVSLKNIDIKILGDQRLSSPEIALQN